MFKLQAVLLTGLFQIIVIQKGYSLSISKKNIINKVDNFLSSPNPSRVFINGLNDMRTNNEIFLWSSTLADPYKVSKLDLQIVTRTSFSSEDYFGDIVKAAKSSQSYSVETPLTIAFFISIFIALFSSQLPIDQSARNTLGIFFLYLPFLVIGFNSIVPGFINNLQASYEESKIDDTEQRIAYHEAGHFLISYLCGIPILEYDVSGEKDAGLAVIASIPDVKVIQKKMQKQMDANKQLTGFNKKPTGEALLKESKTGNLLIVAMAGVVAETLRFGESKGGIEDFPIALEILRQYGINFKDMEDYLRWAVLKALTLLRIHRDTLDEIANIMMKGKTIGECIACIEENSSSLV